MGLSAHYLFIILSQCTLQKAVSLPLYGHEDQGCRRGTTGPGHTDFKELTENCSAFPTPEFSLSLVAHRRRSFVSLLKSIRDVIPLFSDSVNK